jgi:hypothetical protein
VNTFSFVVEDAAKVGRSGKMVMAVVDGVSLAERVLSFEKEQGWRTDSTVGGRYEALILSCYGYAAMNEHFLGWGGTMGSWGKTTLLVCGCGIMTCWPLIARIKADWEQVVWSEFAQPHRPEWDYSGFGPFVFEREAYDEVLGELVAKL